MAMKNIFFILIIVFFSGCIPKVQSEKMILDTVAYKQLTKDSINVFIYGDEGVYFPGNGILINNVKILDKKEILDAVVKSIQKSAMFGPIENNSTYKLDVFIIKALNIKSSDILTWEISLEMAWNLSKDNKTIWRKTITSLGKNKTFIGYDRVEGAYNDAVKNNIDKALSQISELNLK
jgi:lipoprotein